MKVGDKVLCIKERNQFFVVGRYYEIQYIFHSNVTIDRYEFHTGEWRNGYYNFSDYFDTELSIRRKKLKKIGSRL